MTLRFTGPEGRKGEKMVYSLACNTCIDPESEKRHIPRDIALPLIIAFASNKITTKRAVGKLARYHEGLFGKNGKRHKLEANRRPWTEVKAGFEKMGGVLPDELAPGHPDYQKQKASRAKVCPLNS